MGKKWLFCSFLIVLTFSSYCYFNSYNKNFAKSNNLSYNIISDFSNDNNFKINQDIENWIPSILPWNDATPTAIDNRFLLSQIAGEKGFLNVGEDGHFYCQEDNSRAKFWGTNINWGGCFPNYEDAEIIASRLAKFGFNLVRFHKFDTEYTERGTIFSRDYPNDSRHFDWNNVDRLDYFIYQLKMHGISVLIDLHAERGFKEGDGVIGGNHSGLYDWIPQSGGGWVNGNGKFLTIFNQTFIDLQKEFAENLLIHINPYTNLRYVDDPAIALIEITNENSMLLGYTNDYIYEHVRNTDAANAADIHPYYLEQLDIQWNSWLSNKYSTLNALQTAWTLGEELPSGSNLLTNGGFESTINPWIFNVKSGWNADATIDYSTKVEGSSSIKITLYNKGIGGLIDLNLTQTLNGLIPGENYYLTFWGKSSMFGTKIQPMETIGNWLWGPEIYLGKEWRKYYCTLKVTSNQGQIVFDLGELPKFSSIWIDDVQLHLGGIFGLRSEESWDNNSIARIKYGFRHSYTWNRFKDEQMFYMNLDYNYGAEMKKFLKNIGVKTPITHTNGYYGFTSVPGRYDTSDYIDAHVYWDPPYAHQYTWGSDYVTVTDGGFMFDLMFLGFKNKPLTVSEWNFLFPQKTQYQGPIMVSSYASFQDADALLIFDLYWNTSEIDLRANFIPGWYSIARNPTMMFQSFISSRLFLRDVSSAQSTLQLNYTNEQIFENMNQSPGYVPTYYPYNLDRNYCHLHGLRLAITNISVYNFTTNDIFNLQNINEQDFGVLAPPFISDTNEIFWNPSIGYFYVNTTQTKVILGLFGGKSLTVGNLNASINSEHGSIALLSLDGKSTDQSDHLILITQSTSRNHGMIFDYNIGLPKPDEKDRWGSSPSEILLVEGQIKIALQKEDISAETISIYGLDETGERKTLISYEIETSDNPRIIFNIGQNNCSNYEIIIGEIPTTQITTIKPYPAIVGKSIQFFGTANHQLGIKRYMWGIKESEDTAEPNLKKNSFYIKDVSIKPQIYIPDSREEAYSVFSWEQNAILTLNSTGKYQIFFKALATSGVWSNLIKAILIVKEPNVFQRNPFLHIIWIVPIVSVIVLTISIIKIKKKRKI